MLLLAKEKKLDSSITNSTQFLTPGAENIKNIAERVLRTPSVQQQQYLDAQQATKLAMWESNPQNPLPDTIRVNQRKKCWHRCQRENAMNTQSNSNAGSGCSSHDLLCQIDEMIKVFDWRTVYGVHTLTTDDHSTLDDLKERARDILKTVAEKGGTVIAGRFCAFVENTGGNLVLEYNIARIEGLESLRHNSCNYHQTERTPSKHIIHSHMENVKL